MTPRPGSQPGGELGDDLGDGLDACRERDALTRPEGERLDFPAGALEG
jgi:hypothetical protein